MSLFADLKVKIKEDKRKIVLPEGEDIRVLEAAGRLSEEGLMDVIILGNKEEIGKKAKEINVNLDKLELIDPSDSDLKDELLAAFMEARKGRIEEDEAKRLIDEDLNYFGTLLVHTGKADGLVSGAAHSTPDTIRPALQIIRMEEGYKKTSGLFIMMKEDELLLMSDCAITINPDSNDLAENALLSAKTGRAFGMDPKVAMLSFSTLGSTVDEETEKVAEATKIAKEKDSSLAIDGEFQFDTAYDPGVAKSKAPESDVAGNANIFIFPSLEAGNIGYKIAQRMGGYEAVGPILQGLNKPVNDLSRGCSSEDVYKVAIITAAQV